MSFVVEIYQAKHLEQERTLAFAKNSTTQSAGQTYDPKGRQGLTCECTKSCQFACISIAISADQGATGFPNNALGAWAASYLDRGIRAADE